MRAFIALRTFLAEPAELRDAGLRPTSCRLNQVAPPACHGGARISVHSGVGTGTKVYNPIVLGILSREYAVEVCPPVGLDLGLEIAADLEVASRPELKMRAGCSCYSRGQ
jgi:hypothetical protein